MKRNRAQAHSRRSQRSVRRLARVLERLQAPGLRQGIARGLSKHVKIRQQEIAELEQP